MGHFARNAPLAVGVTASAGPAWAATKSTVAHSPIIPEQNASWIDVIGQQGLVEGDLDVNASDDQEVIAVFINGHTTDEPDHRRKYQ